MFPKVLKLIIASLLFIFGFYQIYENYVGNGIFCLLLSATFILIYFKNEIIFLAFLRLRKQDFVGTEKWLNYIRNPEASLVRKQQGYFNYLHGIIQSQINLTIAEKYFKKALQLGLSMSHDVAMAKLSLAGILMQKRRKREATELLNQAKKLDKHGMMTNQIKMMRDQMKRI
jgi:TM2 domain-containing membrane protein YozV